MTLAQRIHTLTHHGFTDEAIAALFDMEQADVQELLLDPAASVPSPESGSDLSAVDQDITVLNDHALVLQGDIDADPALAASMHLDSDNYDIVVEGVPANDGSNLRVNFPEGPASGGRWVSLNVNAAGPSITFRAGGDFFFYLSFFNGVMRASGDVRFDSTFGPVLMAPDDSLHRLVVANDGTLSAEPVV